MAVTLLFTSLAQAQATRTWVSGTGDDANPCSRTAPCKTFAGAISKTAINGEIDALDPAGYGTVTITKSITIDGGTGAGWGSILASGTVGVTVNTNDFSGNDPLHTVILRHLSINGTGLSGTAGTRTGTVGINYVQASALFVEDCTIFNFATVGIQVNLSGVGNGYLDVERTTIESNQKCVTQTVTGGIFNSAFNNCVFNSNVSNGLEVNAGTATVNNSHFTNNGGAGMVAQGSVGSVINVDNSAVDTNAGAGIQVGSSFGTVRASANNVHRNGTGLSNSGGGSFNSCKNNVVVGNTTDINGVIPTSLRVVNSKGPGPRRPGGFGQTQKSYARPPDARSFFACLCASRCLNRTRLDPSLNRTIDYTTKFHLLLQHAPDFFRLTPDGARICFDCRAHDDDDRVYLQPPH